MLKNNVNDSEKPASISDWRYVVKGSFKVKYISDYIGASPVDVYYAQKTYSGEYYKNIVSVSLQDFLVKNGFNIEDTVGIGEHDFYPLKKEDIEVDSGVFKRCVTSGFYLLSKVFDGTSIKLILELEESMFRTEDWEVAIYYSKKFEKHALKFLNDLDSYALDNNYLRGKKIDASLSHVKLDKDYSWDDVILPKHVKNELNSNVVSLFNNIDILKKSGMTIKRGLILKGVPGTGKTLIGKVLCNQLDCSFLWITPKYLQNSRVVKYICDLSREISPTILFLEDIDLYGSDRSSASDPTILGELMNQLDGLVSNDYVITVATTNRAEILEDAIRNRPGRFDRVIDIPKPDYGCRVELINLYTKMCNTDNLDKEKIAQITDGLTGAHMRELIATASMRAVEKGNISNDRITLDTGIVSSSVKDVKTKDMNVVGFDSSDDDEYYEV